MIIWESLHLTSAESRNGYCYAGKVMHFQQILKGHRWDVEGARKSAARMKTGEVGGLQSGIVIGKVHFLGIHTSFFFTTEEHDWLYYFAVKVKEDNTSGSDGGGDGGIYGTSSLWKPSWIVSFRFIKLTHRASFTWYVCIRIYRVDTFLFLEFSFFI